MPPWQITSIYERRGIISWPKNMWWTWVVFWHVELFSDQKQTVFSFKKCININIMVAQKPCPRRMALTWMVIGTTVLVFVTATLLTVLLTGRWLSIWFIINLIFSELGPGFLSSCISLHPCKTTLILRTEAYSPSVLGRFSKAAVAVDGKPCAQIAKWELWTWW